MAIVTLENKEFHTSSELPNIGELASNFVLTGTDLTEKKLSDFKGKTMLLNIYPSIDTNVCFLSVKKFNQTATEIPNVVIACISMDLPFALKRMSDAEHFSKVLLLSDFRNRAFGEAYGLRIVDGPLAGLLARAVVILNHDHKVVYHQLVKEISQQPDYDAALNVLIAGAKNL